MVKSGIASAIVFAFAFFTSSVVSKPIDTSKDLVARGGVGGYWLSKIKHQGSSPFAANSANYQVFRDVTAFGAKNDGSADASAAINAAITAGSRCGQGCDSTTTLPALVYFPPGTYLISSPIIQYYYTQFVGDALNPPTLKGSANFKGQYIIDTNIYYENGNGAEWFTNQNNFYRQIRNFVIDMTAMSSTAIGIHWQVSQATSLQNIRFEMAGAASSQSGIFMENGSGGFISDLVFNNGGTCAIFGSQQYTTRNLQFNNCGTAIQMLWNWGWLMSGIKITGGKVGIDMSGGSDPSAVGSAIVMDSTIGSTIGITTGWSRTNLTMPGSAAIVLDNVAFTCVQAVVSADHSSIILPGPTTVQSWVQGETYQVSKPLANNRFQGSAAAPVKNAALLNNGAIFTRSKPQYENVDVSNIISIKFFGAVGNGKTDDTAAFRNAMASITPSQVLFIDHGAYVITDTIVVQPGTRIVGEHWPTIFCSGSSFTDIKNTKVFWQIGTPSTATNPAPVAGVEMSDLMFSTTNVIGGVDPVGAVMIEWNIYSTQGASGMWDVHYRIGGSAGSGLQSNRCKKDSSFAYDAVDPCMGASLLFHATPGSGNVYLENTWLWVADHELDLTDHSQIDIYNGRGMLVESKQGASWYWGTASEHNSLYNYQVFAANNVFMGFIQSETPYMQGNPNARDGPFASNKIQAFNVDPTWGNCSSLTDSWEISQCAKSWGFRFSNVNNLLIYGAGLYSFFDNYDNSCVATNNCQWNMFGYFGEANKDIYLYGISTKASDIMVTRKIWTDDAPNKSPDPYVAIALESAARSNFVGTIASLLA